MTDQQCSEILKTHGLNRADFELLQKRWKTAPNWGGKSPFDTYNPWLRTAMGDDDKIVLYYTSDRTTIVYCTSSDLHALDVPDALLVDTRTPRAVDASLPPRDLEF